MDIQTETERQIMKKIKYRNDKITFDTFLSGTPARDYVFQKMPYAVSYTHLTLPTNSRV